jgi:hypothetical protein
MVEKSVLRPQVITQELVLVEPSARILWNCDSKPMTCIN